jgi:hypothetical protein
MPAPKITAEQRAAGLQKARDNAAERKRVHLQMVAASMDELAKDAPPRGQEMVARARAKGTLRALVAAKCGECSNWQREEIRRCHIVACPLHAVRPFQPAQEEADPGGDSR